MDTPEWSIFDRLEELEEITLKLMEKADTTEPTLKDTSTVATDARILARMAVSFGFTSVLALCPDPRMVTNVWIDTVKKTGLSTEEINRIESIMITSCESIEKHRKNI